MNTTIQKNAKHLKLKHGAVIVTCVTFVSFFVATIGFGVSVTLQELGFLVFVILLLFIIAASYDGLH